MNEKVNKGPIATRVASLRSSFQSGILPNDPRFLPFPQLHKGLTVRPSTSAGIPFARYSQVSRCFHFLQRSANAGKRSLHARVSSSRVTIWISPRSESFANTGETFGMIFLIKGTTHASTTTVWEATSSLISFTKIKVYMPIPSTGLQSPYGIRACCGSSKPQYLMNIVAILSLRLTIVPLSAWFERSLAFFSVSERVILMWMESHSSFFFADGIFNAGMTSKLR